MARPKKIERMTPQQKELFRKKNFGHLATVGANGAPHVAPVWLDLGEDDRIVINTEDGRTKVENMRRESRVAISVHDEDNPYAMVSVTGEIEEMTDEGADDHIDFLAKKYLGKDRYPGRAPGHRRLIVRIRPTRIASMGLDEPERAVS